MRQARLAARRFVAQTRDQWGNLPLHSHSSESGEEDHSGLPDSSPISPMAIPTSAGSESPSRRGLHACSNFGIVVSSPYLRCVQTAVAWRKK